MCFQFGKDDKSQSTRLFGRMENGEWEGNRPQGSTDHSLCMQSAIMGNINGTVFGTETCGSAQERILGS